MGKRERSVGKRERDQRGAMMGVWQSQKPIGHYYRRERELWERERESCGKKSGSYGQKRERYMQGKERSGERERAGSDDGCLAESKAHGPVLRVVRAVGSAR